MKSIAIMQPTFAPWIGYLALMDFVDEFVYLDQVQFDKRSWQQRNRIKTPNGSVWLTIPICNKGKSEQSIKDAMINEAEKGYPDKLLKTITHNYSKAPFYAEYSEAVFEIFNQPQGKLIDLNTALIGLFRESFSIKTPLLYSSDLHAEGSKAELLVNICQERGASLYVSPPGSRDYIDDSTHFQDVGIPVSYFDYEHHQWRQLYGDFLPYMSALDLLFNEGESGIDVIRKGYVK